ncbi:MAG TPA: alpha/beta hydrolase, partial [Patescibacteria group bacterium]|nr:alpha/beta hydrolase [Patescibacteria group bacterium]
MVVSGRQIKLDSIELSLLEAGVGGRPMLFLHGFAGGKEDYAGHFVRFAEAGFHVVAPDLRGHGASEAPPEETDYSFEILATDVIELVEELRWETFVLVGHSMGGMIAQEVALKAAERLSALVLVDTSPGGLDMDKGPATAAVELVRSMGTERLATLIATGGPGPL